MNKFKSHRSKRRRIQEQLFAYTSNDVPIISPNVLTVEDESNPNIQVQTISEVLPDVSNAIHHFFSQYIFYGNSSKNSKYQ